MMNSLRLRESVAMGRGVHGGNGILAGEYDIARFFADAEDLHMKAHMKLTPSNGRAITGDSAFI